ncbi:hypothetical protein Aco03nite_100140 [Actinoplanes couchii]|uniref:Methyltransferase type 11 domain-containing protein n=2 Tax=Actinoplanes couchii TaxID=403638 RepID=A0ABQ3XT18_9ACTN|nr:hypothetical protein Aco03nite_100140 [Actinoplanes couchii]
MIRLAAWLDPHTLADLDTTGIGPGARCLSLGAGAGTIAAALAEIVAPVGEVVAVDLDTSMLPTQPGITVVQHDLTTGLGHLADAPVQLVEARLLTQHLPNRRALLNAMIAATAPGGSILIAEVVNPRPYTLHAPALDDGNLVDLVLNVLGDAIEPDGADMEWGREGVHNTLAEAGAAVHTRWHAETWTGGSYPIQLLADGAFQKRDRLFAAGLTIDDLDRFTDLPHDPQLTVRSYEIAFTHARLPYDGATRDHPRRARGGRTRPAMTPRAVRQAGGIPAHPSGAQCAGPGLRTPSHFSRSRHGPRHGDRYR